MHKELTNKEEEKDLIVCGLTGVWIGGLPKPGKHFLVARVVLLVGLVLLGAQATQSLHLCVEGGT